MLTINKNLININNNNVKNFRISFTSKPQYFSTNALNKDSVSLSSNRQYITIQEIKDLIPSGKLEDNYIIQDMKKLLEKLDTDRKTIDLSPELTDEDYAIIQKLMNKENGKYIKDWIGYSDTDDIPNIQKLALFARTMRLTNQTADFLDFDSAKWQVATEGIIKKPENMIMPVFEYKVNSDKINRALSGIEADEETLRKIEILSEYLDMFEVKDDFEAYRGDKSFGILASIKIDNDMNLAELIEIFSEKFQKDYQNDMYDENEAINFAKEYIINKKIFQPRFMSIGMTQRAIEQYAKKIKWIITVPQGTKGTSIESYNFEREAEAEFLGQRNGTLRINKATYDPKNDIWIFRATLEQSSID